MDDFKPRMGEYGLPEEALKPNSMSYKKQHPEEVKPKGKVVKKKSRLTNAFIMNDLKTVAFNIWTEDLFPLIKTTFVNTVESAVELIFLGEKRNDSKKKQKTDVTSYSKYYREKERSRIVSTRSRFDTDKIIYGSLDEAEEVRDNILQATGDYQYITVANVYEMSGLRPPYTADKWGWKSTSLNSLDILETSSGYIIELPRAKEIE